MEMWTHDKPKITYTCVIWSLSINEHRTYPHRLPSHITHLTLTHEFLWHLSGYTMAQICEEITGILSMSLYH